MTQNTHRIMTHIHTNMPKTLAYIKLFIIARTCIYLREREEEEEKEEEEEISLLMRKGVKICNVAITTVLVMP